MILYILIAGVLLLLPYVIFPTLPFGVRIPLAYARDPAVTAERRRYMLRLGIFETGLLLIDLALGMRVGRWGTLPQFSLIVLVIGGWGVYYLSHRRLARVKTSQQWFANTRQAVAASAAPRSKLPSRFFWIFLSFPCAVLLLTSAVGVWRYSALPARLDYVFSGNLGNWTLVTTPVNAFLPVLFQCISTLLLAALAWLRNFGSQPIDVEDPAGSLRYNQINTHIIQILLLLLALGLNGAFLAGGLIGWNLLQVSSSLTDGIILAPLAVWLIVAPVLLLGLRRKPRVPAENGGLVNRDDDRFWRLGMIYVNRGDPALLVTKRFGIGRTLNFGNPVAWGIALVIVVLLLARLLTRL